MSFLSLIGVGTAFADTAIKAAPHAAAAGKQSLLQMLALPALFVVVFYFLLIRPQSKKTKEHRQRMSELKVGDEIATSGGIVGRLTKLNGDFVSVITNGATELTLQKSAVATILPKGTMDSTQS
ncbi:MAG: preprotein translocase subunit YajC [Coxiellaceae bacterium]|nr:preprotein translocase subunit YajC [Coxiellaceae bacterium]